MSCAQAPRDKPPGSTFSKDGITDSMQNLDEKGHQIRLMGEIYTSAHRVVAYLGRASDDSNLAINFVSTLQHTFRRLMRTGTPTAIETISRQPMCEFQSLGWESLRMLLQRVWFERVWVVQETVKAAKDPLLVCGDLAVSWQTFAMIMFVIMINDLTWFLAPSYYGPGSAMIAPNGFSNTISILELKTKAIDRTIQTVVASCVGFRSTNPQCGGGRRESCQSRDLRVSLKRLGIRPSSKHQVRILILYITSLC